MTITFPVSPEVKAGEPGRLKNVALQDSIKAVTGVIPEACAANVAHVLGGYVDRYVGPMSMNGLLRAVHASFADHYPLVLSPDDIWIAIAQGFAAHVNAHAEELRHHFVKHEGKAYIEVRRDGFVKGAPDNDWPGAFTEFSDKIAEHVGKKRDLLVSSFSTTGLVEKTASEIVLMDTLQQFFEYGMMTSCGIPKITLLGQADDWKQIRDRARALSEFGCGPWIDALVPVLDKFVDAFAGNADPTFWKSFYKEGGGSGGPYVTGAINVFFPYLASRGGFGPNDCLHKWSRGVGRMMGGPTPEDFPKGIAKVPFIWHYYADDLPMLFLGGFVGASQDPETLAIRPAIGWGVADREP